jgi:hypothetical protein
VYILQNFSIQFFISPSAYPCSSLNSLIFYFLCSLSFPNSTVGICCLLWLNPLPVSLGSDFIFNTERRKIKREDRKGAVVAIYDTQPHQETNKATNLNDLVEENN